MNPASTSSDQLHQQQKEDVISFLEQHEECFELLGEIQMLEAMFEDAKVFLVHNNNNNNNNNQRNNPAQATSGSLHHNQQQSTTTTKSKTVSAASQNNGHSKQKSSLPAISMQVPLRTLQGDGQTTLASVLLSIVLEQPDRFPNSCDLSIRFKSMQLSPQLRSDLGDQLSLYAKELQKAESLTVGMIASRAEEMLLDLPVAQQSSHFGCCLSCNKNQMAKKMSKVPSPLRLHLDPSTGQLIPKKTSSTGCVGESSDETTGQPLSASKQQMTGKNNKNNNKKNADSDSGLQEKIGPTSSQCLMCKEQESIIVIPSMKPTKKTECSMCMCEDFPLISFANCSCISCFDCFVRMAEIAIGAKQIKRPIFGFRSYGIACPTHPRDSILNDVGLIRLIPKRSFFRFNAFCVKDFITSIGGFVCANPRCESSLPQVSSYQKTGLTICLFCERATCLSCGLESVHCECQELKMAERTPLKELRDRLYRAECAKVAPVSPAASGDILFVLGKFQKILTLSFDDKSWYDHALAYVWSEHIPLRKQHNSSFICVFNGAVLNPEWSLRDCGVTPSSFVFLIPLVETNSKQIDEEAELWRFRRTVKKKDSVELENTMFKDARKCPNPSCKKPLIHYKYHHCHHLSCLCGEQICFNCMGPYPCKASPRCSVFCNATCTCPPCPECSPGYRCDLCQGCPKCMPEDTEEGFGQDFS